MARSRRTLVGRLSGDVGGTPETLLVYKDGRDYRLVSNSRDYLCHPSVRDVTKLRGEALLVFHMASAEFEPI